MALAVVHRPRASRSGLVGPDAVVVPAGGAQPVVGRDAEPCVSAGFAPPLLHRAGADAGDQLRESDRQVLLQPGFGSGCGAGHGGERDHGGDDHVAQFGGEIVERGAGALARVLPGHPEVGELVSHIESAHSISQSVVETLSDQTEVFPTLDRQMGATQLVDSMARHLETLSDALTFAVMPNARKPVASALAEAATLAVWQALDVGAADRAWRHYELAKQAARETDQPKYLAHAMGEQAYVLIDAGRADLAIELVSEALRSSRSIPLRLHAWLLGAQAEILALNGNSEACKRSLDTAMQILPVDGVLRDPDIPSIFLTDAHLARWRGHALALVGDGQAVADLHAALDSMDSTFTRAKAGLLCDLAQAHLVRGELGDASKRLQEARLLANRTGSVRHLRQIDRITGQLPS